ncbi:MAG: hypothetical protein KTR31_08425 [Myxococcales bacterium]|nr:hypothetical protein [Myxococcales bacterium]
MNPNLCRVVLRPRGPLEVFDLTLALIRVHAGRFGLLAALTVLPFVALAFGLTYVVDDPWLIPLFLPLVFGLLQAPFTVLAGRLLFADEVPLRQVVMEVLRGIVPTIAASGWLLLALLLGLGCGFAGVAITVPATAYVTEAALLEKVGVMGCLRRSMRLASSNPGIALSTAFGWAFLTFWGVVVAEAAGQSMVGFVLQLGQPFGSLVAGQVTPYALFGALAAQPLMAVYRLLLYVDARTRIEGWDLQVGLRAAGLAAK